MPFFTFRRRPPKPAPRLPDVYVAVDYWSGSALRFFFMEELWQKETVERTGHGSVKVTSHPPSPEAIKLINEIEVVTGARINSHRQYLALHWGYASHPPEETEQVVIDLLSNYFGWSDPLVEYFTYGSAEMHEVERLRGIRWNPSS